MKVHDKFTDEEVTVPEHIIDPTEALLGTHAPTNQLIVLQTATWWFKNVGNCPIYRWCVHYLNGLEQDTMTDIDVYSDAREQAEDIGLSV